MKTGRYDPMLFRSTWNTLRSLYDRDGEDKNVVAAGTTWSPKCVANRLEDLRRAGLAFSTRDPKGGRWTPQRWHITAEGRRKIDDGPRHPLMG